MNKRNNEEKKLLDKMKELLLRGERMLGEVCPKCGTPLFLIKETGLKYCPRCNVYLATPEELERAKIDKSMLKIMDFNEYWGRKEAEKLTKEEEKKGEIEKIKEEKKVLPHPTPHKAITPDTAKVLDALDELIITVIERLIMRLDREEAPVEKLFEWLFLLVKLRKSVYNESKQ